MKLCYSLIFIAIIGYVRVQLNNKKTKAPSIKKDEILQQYKQELRTILKKNENNRNKQLQQKKLKPYDIK